MCFIQTYLLLLQVFTLQRELQLQRELSNLGCQRLAKSKSKQDIVKRFLCQVQSKADLNRPFEPSVSSTPSENACSETIKEDDSGLEIAPDLSQQLTGLQSKESRLLEKESKQDGKLEQQLAELQRELYALKLQQTADAVSHQSIVEALEAAAEEEQAAFAAQVGEFSKELERSNNKSTSSQLKTFLLLDELDKVRGYYQEAEQSRQDVELQFVEATTECEEVELQLVEAKKESKEVELQLVEAKKECEEIKKSKEECEETEKSTRLKNSQLEEDMLETEKVINTFKVGGKLLEAKLVKVKKQQSELYETFKTEKRERLKEAVSLAKGLVERVALLEGHLEAMFKRNTELTREKDQLANECEEHDNRSRSLNAYVGELERSNEEKYTVLREIQEKKARRKGWRKLKCW